MSEKPKPKRPFRAASLFDPNPDPRSDEEEAEDYLRAAREKVAIAERTLRELKDAEQGLTYEGFAEALLGDDDNLRLIEGYGDTVILELHGALDAFSCAVAYRLKLPTPDGGAFSGLKPGSGSLRDVVEQLRRDERWTHLVYYRNLAAHKEVLVKSAWADDTGIHRLRLPDRLPRNPKSENQEPPHEPLAKVIPILEELTTWTREGLAQLEEAFRQTF